MRKKTVIEYFGGNTATAKALGINRQAVWRWPDPIPEGRAYQVQVLSNGALQVDPSMYEEEAA